MTTHGFRSEERLTAPTIPDFPEHKLPEHADISVHASATAAKRCGAAREERRLGG
jgi:hypothetical protein